MSRKSLYYNCIISLQSRNHERIKILEIGETLSLLFCCYQIRIFTCYEQKLICTDLTILQRNPTETESKGYKRRRDKGKIDACKIEKRIRGLVCLAVGKVINMSRRRIDGNSLNRQAPRMSKRQSLALSRSVHRRRPEEEIESVIDPLCDAAKPV